MYITASKDTTGRAMLESMLLQLSSSHVFGFAQMHGVFWEISICTGLVWSQHVEQLSL